jgi:hypothetical protein
MKDIMDSPGHREFQFIHHRGDLFDDLERPVLFGIELCFLIVDSEVGCL